MALGPTEQLLYTTTRLRSFQGTSLRGVGTGFFYNVQLENGGAAPLLITNKHVIEGCDNVEVIFHLADAAGTSPSGRYIRYHIDFTPRLISHPDPQVDLCAIPIAAVYDHIANQGGRMFFQHVNRGHIPNHQQWENFDAIENLLMIGCPRGLFDERNMLPLARRGSTATHIAKAFQGKNEFLVDIACFPGSSGSPVFLYDTSPVFDRQTRQMLPGQMRLFLVGILYAGPTVTINGEIILNQRPQIAAQSMMHIGQVIRSTEIMEIEALATQQA